MTFLVALELASRYWKALVFAGLLLVTLGAVTTCTFKSDKLGKVQALHEVEKAQLAAEFEAQARQIELNNFQGVINAFNNSQKQAQAIAVDVASANDANKRLHDTIDSLQARAAYSTRDRVEYTASVSNLFKECSGVYLEMAAKADGHANDVRLLQQSRKF